MRLPRGRRLLALLRVRAGECGILFQLPTAAFLPVPSCPALAAAVVALQRLVPWAAWAEGAVVGAWCRVRCCDDGVFLLLM